MKIRHGTLITVLFALLTPLTLAQTRTGPLTITGGECKPVSVDGQSQIAINISGSWSGTIQPKASIAGQPSANVQVVPSTSTTPASTITANGLYTATVAGFQSFQLCGNTVTGTATVYFVTVTVSAAGRTSSAPAGTVTGTGLTSGNVIDGAGGSAIQDSGIPAGQVVTANSPGVGLCHFAGSTQVCTSSTVVNADIANGTIDLLTKVTNVLPQANGGKIQVTTANQGYFWGTCQNAMAGLGSTAITSLVSGSANQVRAWQCVLPYSVTINKVSIEVQVNSAAQTCNVGIYSADRATKLVDSGTFDMSSGAGAAGTTRTNTLGAPVTVSGPIWVGFSCSDTTAAIGAAGGILGANVGAVFANIAGGPIMGSAANATSAGVMPASLGTITQATTISTSPLMRFEP